MKTKEERNAYMREYMRKRRANQTDEDREKNKNYMREYRKNEKELAKVDSGVRKRLEAREEKARNYSRQKINELKQNPKAWAQYKKQQSRNSSTYFKNLQKKATDGDQDAIEKLKKRNAYISEYNRKRYAEKKAQNKNN